MMTNKHRYCGTTFPFYLFSNRGSRIFNKILYWGRGAEHAGVEIAGGQIANNIIFCEPNRWQQIMQRSIWPQVFLPFVFVSSSAFSVTPQRSTTYNISMCQTPSKTQSNKLTKRRVHLFVCLSVSPPCSSGTYILCVNEARCFIEI